MSYTSYSNTERYATARHEAIHALSAVHFGIDVERVDVVIGQTSAHVAGQTSLRLPIELYELLSLVRTDRARAVQIATSVIGTCVAPSIDEKTDSAGNDASLIREVRQYWYCTAPAWDTLYYDTQRQARLWLRQPGTERAIQRLSQNFFVHGRIDGVKLQRMLGHAPAPPVTTSPKPTAPASRTMSARQMLNEAMLKYYDYCLNPSKSLYCKVRVPSPEALAREERSIDAS